MHPVPHGAARAAAGGVLQNVQYGELVEFVFSLGDTAADVFVAHLNEAGQGRIIWGDVD